MVNLLDSDCVLCTLYNCWRIVKTIQLIWCIAVCLVQCSKRSARVGIGEPGGGTGGLSHPTDTSHPSLPAMIIRMKITMMMMRVKMVNIIVIMMKVIRMIIRMKITMMMMKTFVVVKMVNIIIMR